ncbi:DUF5916 domain-containing protein [Aridibaculum aurantiacum]|uniref:DUF5916 domain-containing protein n=1 Tax=Aridibaculum aurantiacum TaxID=2810307 RepID=UPI001A964B43|nr:DUF5916 domain-containing protein [Aridibaculum aurantiacum]
MRYQVACLFVFLLATIVTVGQPAKTMVATKISQPPRIDGKLQDPAWQQATPVSGFIVNQPAYGQPAAQNSEIKLLYDDAAIYVGAFLHDDPALIRKQLTPRDGEQRQDIDYFSISFDTYNDKQNAFQFIVTAANVQSDIRISPTGSDYQWDAVWESKTSITEDGWMVEMKIPYMALRFSRKEVQDWGINFGRFTRRTNESAYWNPVNPNVNGFVNQMGSLVGLENLQPPVRLSFQPYVSAGYSVIPTRRGNQETFLRNGGMDLKYGVNESFTIDMTLVPDFGQVQSDNVILNLSPFEQQFNENRPFFTEGTELFNKAGIFYSRRVGAMPGGYHRARRLAADSSYQIVSNPTATQLYNATKFSGRNRHKLGIGVFNAVTAPMHAVLRNDKGEEFEVETEPLANYNIVVLDQALKNRSAITFTNTNVMRAGNSRNANVTALDIVLYDNKNDYRIVTRGRFSQIWGNEKYNGYKSYVAFEKVSGRITYSLNNTLESDRFDPNDLGILLAPNEVRTAAHVGYHQNTPTKNFNFYHINLNVYQQSLYKPFVYQESGYRANALFVFKNFWDVNIVSEGKIGWFNDYFELRSPGKVLKRAPWQFVGIFGSSDSRKKLFGGWGFGFAESPIPNDAFYLVEASLRYRFNPRFSLSINANREEDQGNFGWVTTNSATGVPVIGKRHITSYNNLVNAIYNFTPRMNLTMRARHYWSKVHYLSFHDVQADGHWTDRPFINNADRNFNVFNMDMFYTWDFRLGSRLIVAWKNALGPDAAINGIVNRNYSKNLNQVFQVPHSNEVTVKFIYFLDYQQLRRQKKAEG